MELIVVVGPRILPVLPFSAHIDHLYTLLTLGIFTRPITFVRRRISNVCCRRIECRGNSCRRNWIAQSAGKKNSSFCFYLHRLLSPQMFSLNERVMCQTSDRTQKEIAALPALSKPKMPIVMLLKQRISIRTALLMLWISLITNVSWLLCLAAQVRVTWNRLIAESARSIRMTYLLSFFASDTLIFLQTAIPIVVRSSYINYLFAASGAWVRKTEWRLQLSSTIDEWINKSFSGLFFSFFPFIFLFQLSWSC